MSESILDQDQELIDFLKGKVDWGQQLVAICEAKLQHNVIFSSVPTDGAVSI